MSAKSHSYIKTMPEKPKEDMSGKLLSPMPGTVISVDVQVGDMVAEGQTVAVVEAMKMQNGEISLKTSVYYYSLGLSISRDGEVKAIHVSAGDKVADEDIILELE